MYFSSSHHRIARAHTFPSVHHIACVCVRARVFPVCIVTSCGRESCVCKFESVNALSIDIFSSIWNFASLHRMRYVYGIPEHTMFCVNVNNSQKSHAASSHQVSQEFSSVDPLAKREKETKKRHQKYCCVTVRLRKPHSSNKKLECNVHARKIHHCIFVFFGLRSSSIE